MDLTGQEKSFALAVAVIQDRVKNLSQEDKDDLFSLVPALFNDDEEEQQAAFKAAYEIIHPIKAKVKPVQCVNEPIQNWLTFVSTKIRAAREEAGMTQEQLAEATGLQQPHISRLEKGEHSPTAKTLKKIADAIGVEMSYFYPSAA
jgi:DNA-binding XRE family transcriptional regulator